MPERLPPPDLLVAFEAAARHLSFTRAAAERFVTQSAVSRQVAQLEALLGVALFERRHRALALTPAGAQLAQTVARVLAELRTTVAQVRAQPRRELLSLTTTPGLASLWLIPRLADFLAAHPGVDVRIDATLERRDLAREGIDLAIRYAPVAAGGGERLFDETLQPVCAPALPRDRRRPLRTPADLRHHTLLQIAGAPGDREMPGEWTSWLASAGAADVEPAARLSFSAYDAAVAAALAGQGVLLGRRPLVDALLARGALVPAFPGRLASERGYLLVVGPDAGRRPGVQALRAWLLAQAASAAAGAAPAAAGAPAPRAATRPGRATAPSKAGEPSRRASAAGSGVRRQGGA